MVRTTAAGFPLIVGGNSNNATGISGAFTFNVNNAPSNANWNIGAGLSYLFSFRMQRRILTQWRKIPDIGRRSIGYQPKKPTGSVTVRRSDGQTRGAKGGMAPRSMSRLMRLLFEKRLSGRTLLDKLKRLFRKLTKTGGNEP